MNNTRFNHLWLAESIRLIELQSGPFEDSEANRQAKSSHDEIEKIITSRALLLAQRTGLSSSLQLWQQSAFYAGLLLAFFALFSGFALTLSALGSNEVPVNIFWAVTAVLGLHLLSALLWLFSLKWAPGRETPLLGRFWLWLTAKLSHDIHIIKLTSSLIALLNRQRALRWGAGLFIHSWWLLALISATATLLFLLSTKHYVFLWQSTLLTDHSVIWLTHTLGVLPAWFGFPTPDLETVINSGNHALQSPEARYQWAGWLIGIVVTYGLIPRFLLLIFCLLRWRYSKRLLSLDLTLPENQLLIEKLQPSSERIGITDADPGIITALHKTSHLQHTQGNILVAIELDDQYPWPPQHSAVISDAGMLNDSRQRKKLLDKLHQTPASKLLITCDPKRTPDRGLVRLLTELVDNSNQARIWLLDKENIPDTRLQQWRNIMNNLNLLEADLNWLEGNYE